MKTGREVTIYDIARELGLSPSTVSRALKDHAHISRDTKKKIIAAAKSLGYQRNKFASNLRLRKTHTLGVVVPRLNSYFMATAIAGIEKVTNRNGYSLIISQSQESVKKEIESISTLFNSRVDGLLVSLASDTRNLDHFKTVFSKNIPVVFFDRVLECSGCANIIINNYRAAWQLTDHLLSQGCRRIFHLSGNLRRNVYSERLRGYRDALTGSGHHFDNELLMESNLDEDSGREAARRIIKMKNRPDGVFTANDTSAVSLILALREAGIDVPGEIAVAGFNNEPVSTVVVPNLTTVNYPSHEIGEVAAETLINKLNSSSSATLNTIVLEHKLIIRESSLRSNNLSK